MPLDLNFNNMCTWSKAPHILNLDSFFNSFSYSLGQKIMLLRDLEFHACLEILELQLPGTLWACPGM
jgi:hypothetical protein